MITLDDFRQLETQVKNGAPDEILQVAYKRVMLDLTEQIKAEHDDYNDYESALLTSIVMFLEIDYEALNEKTVHMLLLAFEIGMTLANNERLKNTK